MTADTLTVLTSVGGALASKIFSRGKDGRIKNKSYGNAKHFAVATVDVEGIAELARALERTSRNRQAFIIRGEPLDGINRRHARRLLYPDKKTGEPATLTERPRHWFLVDGDAIPCPAAIDPISDPEGAVEHVIGLLPPELHDATCWWQFSSQQSVDPDEPPSIRLHLWFWSEVPLAGDDLKRWAKAANAAAGFKLIDPAPFSAAQAHYLARPDFVAPLDDPLPRRSGMRHGLDEAVTLIIPPPMPKHQDQPSTGGYEPGLGVAAYLAMIGPQAVREPIFKAISSHISLYGSAADCEPLKAAIRKALAEADTGGRSAAELERYASDEHLDEMIDWVRTQHGDQAPRHQPMPEPPEYLDEPPPAAAPVAAAAVTIEDFWGYLPGNNFLYVPTREPWPAASVNAKLPPQLLFDEDGLPVLDEESGEQVKLPANHWLARKRSVEQMIWTPDEPLIIRHKLLVEGGWISRPGAHGFNLYRPPNLIRGDVRQAAPWLDHMRLIYPEDADHLVRWFAHRVQRPAEKINHALLLAGEQGIGKDSLLEPIKRAIGPWNFQEIGPPQLLGSFNGFAQSVILRISEARDLGDFDRYAFYEHLKVYCAAPPDVLRINRKHLHEYTVINCCGVILTTNHQSDAIYLPPDDRRFYVTWSTLRKESFDPVYWSKLWRFYNNGGDRHVAAYLADLDITEFDPKAPPPQTEAFWHIVNTARPSEDAEMADMLDDLKNPDVVTLHQVITRARSLTLHEFADHLAERKNRRWLPHRFAACGYVPVRNPHAGDGLWKIDERRQRVYGKADLSLGDQITAATSLADGRSV
jgi:hypothetical protein